MQHHHKTTMKPIHTDKAPKAVGPYSQAIEHNNIIYVSGQVAIQPETQAFDKDASVAKQTTQALANLNAILEAAGSSKEKVLKVEIFVTDISTFKEVNGLYAEFFGNHKPARQTVEVSALPLGAKIELSCIAWK